MAQESDEVVNVGEVSLCIPVFPIIRSKHVLRASGIEIEGTASVFDFVRSYHFSAVIITWLPDAFNVYCA